MKTKIPLLLATLVTSFMVPSSGPAQNAVVTYQGRVTDNGTNFSGMGQFKFALVTSTNNNHTATAIAPVQSGAVLRVLVVDGGNGYITPPTVTIAGGGGLGATATASISGGAVASIQLDTAGSNYVSPPTVTISPPPETLTFVTYWSNDGTSSAGSEPTAGVSTSVAGGLFTVPLGDVTLRNMIALNATLFQQTNLQLRIWFNDGVNGFAALSPLQNLTTAPYAAVAGSLSARSKSDGGGLTNVNAATLDGVSRDGFWETSGNAGASGATLGTTDGFPLELKVNGQRALRLEAGFDSGLGVVPNLMGGVRATVWNLKQADVLSEAEAVPGLPIPSTIRLHPLWVVLETWRAALAPL